MAKPESKITAQNQISVPAEVRRKLGVGPGSVLEWDERDDEFVVRRARRYTTEDIHRFLFPDGPPKKRVDVKEAIEEYIREKYGRR